MSKNALKEVSDAGRDMKEAVGHVATEWVDNVVENVEEKIETATDVALAKKKTVEKYLKQNPWRAMGITAGIGFVAALLLRGVARR